MVVRYFGEDVIKDRFKYMYDKMTEYINVRKLNATLVINTSILHQMIMNYFTDVYRLKEFHHIANINKTKINAYELYLLLRKNLFRYVLLKLIHRLYFVMKDLQLLF